MEWTPKMIDSWADISAIILFNLLSKHGLQIFRPESFSQRNQNPEQLSSL